MPAPPESYATVAYNGIHTFRWENADGEARHVRWHLEPEAARVELADEEAKARGRDYLQEEIAGRAGAAWRMSVSIAEDGDAIDDPTEQWPDERERVEVGRLELTGVESDREQSPDDVLVFDPTRMIDGIETSDDPILPFRPRAYAVSVQTPLGRSDPVPPGLSRQRRAVGADEQRAAALDAERPCRQLVQRAVGQRRSGARDGPGRAARPGEQRHARPQQVERRAAARGRLDPDVGEAGAEVGAQLVLDGAHAAVRVGGAGGVVLGDRAALGLVAVEQLVARPVRQRPGELPAEVVAVVDGRVHPRPPRGVTRCAASPTRKALPER